MMNKNKIINVLTVLVCLFILFGGAYNNLPEYRIYNSFIQSYTMVDNSDGRNTEINVIVYKNRSDKNLYKRIESEHNRINGEPTELKINLYKWESEIKKGCNPYKTIIINYMNDSVIFEPLKKNTGKINLVKLLFMYHSLTPKTKILRANV